MRAASKGKTDVVVELVKAGANLDLQNEVCPVVNTCTQDGLPLRKSYYRVCTRVLDTSIDQDTPLERKTHIGCTHGKSHMKY